MASVYFMNDPRVEPQFFALIAAFWQLLCAIVAIITPVCGRQCSPKLVLFSFVRPVIDFILGLVFMLLSLYEVFSVVFSLCAWQEPACVEFTARFYSFVVFVMLFAAGLLELLRARPNIALPGLRLVLEDVQEDAQPRCELIDLPGTGGAGKPKALATIVPAPDAHGDSSCVRSCCCRNWLRWRWCVF